MPRRVLAVALLMLGLLAVDRSPARAANLTLACLDLPGVVAHCREAARLFMEATDHTVTVVSANAVGRSSLDRYSALFSIGSNRLDVIHFPDMWLPVLAPSLSSVGGEPDEQLPALRDIGVLHGRRVALPAQLAIGALFIRDNTLPDLPAVWSDLRDGLVPLDDWSEGLFFGAGGPTLFPLVLDWFYSFGAVSLGDGLPLVQALEALDRTVTAIGTEAVTEATPREAAARFLAGDTAVLYGRSSITPVVLPDGGESTVEVAARPRAASAQQTARTLANVWLFGVSRFSREQAAAKELANFLVSTEMQALGAVHNNLAPTRAALYGDETVLESEAPAVVALRLERLAPIPAAEYGSALVVLADEVSAAVREMLRGDATPADTAAAVRLSHRRAERLQ